MKLIFWISITLAFEVSASANTNCFGHLSNKPKLRHLSSDLAALEKGTIQLDKYMASTLGHWIKTSVGYTRYTLIKPKKPTSKYAFLLTGLGYQQEKFVGNHTALEELLHSGVTIINIELLGQGASHVANSFIKNKLPYKIDVKDQVALIQESMSQIVSDLKMTQEKFPFLGLSYGGIVLAELAQNQKTNFIESVTLLSPGVKTLLNHQLDPHDLLPTDEFLGVIAEVQKLFWPILLGSRDQYLYHTIYNIFDSQFGHINNDPVSLAGITALTVGIEHHNTSNIIESVPRDIPIHLIIPGNDEVVPLQMEFNLALALMKRSQNLNIPPPFVALIGGANHDTVASPHPTLQSVILKSVQNSSHGWWIFNGLTLQKVSESFELPPSFIKFRDSGKL